MSADRTQFGVWNEREREKERCCTFYALKSKWCSESVPKCGEQVRWLSGVDRTPTQRKHSESDSWRSKAKIFRWYAQEVRMSKWYWRCSCMRMTALVLHKNKLMTGLSRKLKMPIEIAKYAGHKIHFGWRTPSGNGRWAKPQTSPAVAVDNGRGQQVTAMNNQRKECSYDKL